MGLGIFSLKDLMQQVRKIAGEEEGKGRNNSLSAVGLKPNSSFIYTQQSVTLLSRVFTTCSEQRQELNASLHIGHFPYMGEYIFTFHIWP